MTTPTTVTVTTKPWYTSKTIIVNGVTILIAVLVWIADANNAALLPFAFEPELVVTLLAIANVILRFITSQPIAGPPAP